MAIPSRWMDHDVLVWIVMALFSYNNQKKQQQNQYNYNLTLVWHRQAALGGFFGRSGPDNAVLAVMVEQHPASKHVFTVWRYLAPTGVAERGSNDGVEHSLERWLQVTTGARGCPVVSGLSALIWISRTNRTRTTT
jgi:hypothetical protein